MIYLDNAATTLHKPPQVEQAILEALHTAGNPGRLIPLPREISAGCGLAWRMLPEDWQSWQAELDQTQFDKVTPVEQ